jgi:hypothetical protein
MLCLSENQCGRWIFHAADQLMEMTTEPNWTNKREGFVVPMRVSFSSQDIKNIKKASLSLGSFTIFCGETNNALPPNPKQERKCD